MKSLRVLFLTLALGSIAGVASSATLQQLDRRTMREEARIREGYRSGDLTRVEAMRLRFSAHRIERMERHARRNGVTMAERTRIARAENRLDRRIERFRHNEHRRG